MKSNEQQLVQSVERALEILSLFSIDQQTLSVSEIAGKLNLPKSTVFRLLSTLKSRNFIEKEPYSQRYHLGYKVYDLGNAYAIRLDLRKLAYPIMKELHHTTGETVHLNILDSRERVCVEQIESTHQIRSSIRVGMRSSPCFGAAGKVLLAFSPENEITEIIKYENLTSDQEVSLKKELKAIRETGHIVTIGDRIEDKISISAPIFDSYGDVTAGLSLSGPIERLKVRIETLVEDTIYAAKTISLKMGMNQALYEEKFNKGFQLNISEHVKIQTN